MVVTRWTASQTSRSHSVQTTTLRQYTCPNLSLSGCVCVCVHQQQEEGISVNGEYTRVWKLPGNNTPAGSAATSGKNCVIELSLCWFISWIFTQKTIIWREQYSLVSRRQDGERGSKGLLEEGDEGGVEGVEQGGQVSHPYLAIFIGPLEFHCCSKHSVFPLSTLSSFMLSEQSSPTTWWEALNQISLQHLVKQ